MQGSERSTRRAVAQVKAAWRLGHVRVHRPWVTEPGMWLQYDFGDGPRIDGVKTVLFVAWLAWSRFRVVIALRDKTAPSVFAALDRCFRLLGGAPTYVLTDNEKTVTIEHVAGIPVRNQQTVAFARHYGVTRADLPAGGPGLQGRGGSVGEDRQGRPRPEGHQPARRVRLLRRAGGGVRGVHGRGQHPGAPGHPPQTRGDAGRGSAPAAPGPGHRAHGRVRPGPHVPANTPMVTFENGQYSVPAHLLGARVWVRAHGTGPDEQVIIVHDGAAGPVEVARHGRARPGIPAINDEHFPGPRPRIPGDYDVRARSAGRGGVPGPRRRRQDLADRSRRGGHARMRVKMAEAVTLAKIAGADRGRQGAGRRRGPRPLRPRGPASILNANTAAPPPTPPTRPGP